MVMFLARVNLYCTWMDHDLIFLIGGKWHPPCPPNKNPLIIGWWNEFVSSDMETVETEYQLGHSTPSWFSGTCSSNIALFWRMRSWAIEHFCQTHCCHSCFNLPQCHEGWQDICMTSSPGETKSWRFAEAGWYRELQWTGCFRLLRWMSPLSLGLF